MDIETQQERTRRRVLLRDLERLEPEPGRAGIVTVGEWVTWWIRVLGA